MKISLVIPTNRTSYSAVARVFEFVSLDPSKFELIVRDNSENEDKRTLLRKIDSPTLRFSTAPSCSAFENAIHALRLASGDFVFFVADDDWLSVRGLQQLHLLAIQAEVDTSVACLTGAYLLETSSATGFFQYKGLDSAEPAKRLASYLEANTTNFLYYSAVRRLSAAFCFAFMESLPYRFSYHDQLVSLLYLTLGRVLQVDRVVYYYDLGDWETPSGSLSKDRASYLQAGLPVEYDRLHWLFCAMEGAFLLKSRLLAQKVSFDCTTLSDLWFRSIFARFKHHDRESGQEQNAASAATLAVKNKWSAEPQIDLNELLLDVCDVLEIADSEGAKRYFDFWSTI
jgi:hypothetical protein